MPFAGIGTITGDDNLLVLAANPGDESALCGGLIAQCCRRGRPPYVMVLADGSAAARDTNGVSAAEVAAMRERDTREAAARLGLPRERLLMVGLFDGSVPEEGPVFEAVVRAVTLVMWARDCNTICAPAAPGDRPHHAAAGHVAAEVAARSGVARLAYGPGGVGTAYRLDIRPDLAVKRHAMSAHRFGLAPGGDLPAWEAFWR